MVLLNLHGKRPVNASRLYKFKYKKLKNIIISGGSKGIGKAIAKAFANEGCNIILGARSPLDLEQTREQLIAEYPDSKVTVRQVDFSEKKSVESFVEEVKVLMPHADVIVNNVGQYSEDDLLQYQPEILEKMINTNLFSAYYVTVPFLEQMARRREGHVFNILSVASLNPRKEAASYSISKFALMGFHRVLLEEMRTYNVRVTGIYPGSTLTESWADEVVDAKKFIKPEHIADAVMNAWKLPATSNIEEIVIRPTNL